MPKTSDKRSASMTLSKLILSKVGEFGFAMLNGFFPKKYPEARVWRNILGLDDTYVFSKKKFSAILSKLQSQGFVRRAGSRKKALWTLTSKGEAYLAGMLKKSKSDEFEIKSDGIRRIVMFDIPERERKKRGWMRYHLTVFGYKPIQKSVWSGASPLPKDFIENIQTLGLEHCVHIFSVRDSGTL